MSDVRLDDRGRSRHIRPMGKLIEKIVAGSPAYAVQSSAEGYVLIGESSYRDEFNVFVRELLNRQTEEFVILPVTDGHTGYERAIILPM